jgi:hypothetical protein
VTSLTLPRDNSINVIDVAPIGMGSSSSSSRGAGKRTAVQIIMAMCQEVGGRGWVVGTGGVGLRAYRVAAGARMVDGAQMIACAWQAGFITQQQNQDQSQTQLQPATLLTAMLAQACLLVCEAIRATALTIRPHDWP